MSVLATAETPTTAVTLDDITVSFQYKDSKPDGTKVPWPQTSRLGLVFMHYGDISDRQSTQRLTIDNGSYYIHNIPSVDSSDTVGVFTKTVGCSELTNTARTMVGEVLVSYTSMSAVTTELGVFTMDFSANGYWYHLEVSNLMPGEQQTKFGVVFERLT